MAIPSLTPAQKSPTSILPETGSLGVAANPNTYALGIYANPTSALYDGNFISGAVDQVTYVYRELGGEVLDVELTQKEVFHSYEAAVLEYCYLINLHQAQNVLNVALGTTTGSFNSTGEFTVTGTLSGKENLRFPKYDFALSRRVADFFSGEADVGGTRSIYSASFNVAIGEQDYDLTKIISTSTAYSASVGDKRIYIKRVYYKTPHAMWRFFGYYGGLQAVGNLSTYGMYADDSTFEVIPPWQNKLQAMAYEDAIYTRNSHYSFELKNNKLRIFPQPTGQGPSVMWVEFMIASDPWEDDEDGGNQGTKGVNNINTLPFSNIPFKSINAIGKHWIRRYALANCKCILGQIRGKLDKIPIPGDSVGLNANELLSQCKEEKENLRKEFVDILDKLTYPKLAEQEANVAENAKKALMHVPNLIYVG